MSLSAPRSTPSVAKRFTITKYMHAPLMLLKKILILIFIQERWTDACESLWLAGQTPFLCSPSPRHPVNPFLSPEAGAKASSPTPPDKKSSLNNHHGVLKLVCNTCALLK